jgi:protein Tex
VDPLCELVKVPPPSLGIGMYQHDIKEKVLEDRLGAVLEEVVSEVGE